MSERQLIGLCLCLSLDILGQTTAVQLTAQTTLSPIALRVTDTILLSETFRQPSLALMGGTQCDRDGNLYVRPFLHVERLASPIEKIAPDGKIAVSFSIRSAPEFEKLNAHSFAVGSRGEVYFLTFRKQREPAVVKFAATGRYDSTFGLDPMILPLQLAVFASGELLVSGLELSPGDGKPTGRPLLGLYDGTGQFLREVSLPRDIQWVVPPEEKAPSPEESPEEAATSGTDVEPGDDGNLYLMRPVGNPLVYVISPAGTVLRRLEIRPPADGFRPTGMKAAGGMIAIEFAMDDPMGMGDIYIYSILNAYTGEKFADYSVAREARGIWACYTPNGFTFLTSQDDPPRLAIVKAKP